jgi:hypothetical protein
MKVRRYLPTVVAVVLLLALAGVAAAFSLGNADGVWGTIDTNGATCNYWATGPAGGSTDYGNPTTGSDTDPNVQTGSTTDWNQVRYGNPADYDCPGGSDWKTEFAHQSGFGFDGVNDVTDPAIQVPFLLGKFCHFNNPITADNSFQYVDLALKVDGLVCDNGTTPTPATMSFSRRFTLDETPNNAYPCKYGDDQPCGDQVAIAGTAAAETFRCTYAGGPYVDYTIALQGFIGESDNGCTTYNANKVKYTYFSDEGANNCACVWAMITEYNPTAVELSSFTTTVKREAVRLAWTTASEVDNLGFNLYRAKEVDGPRTQLNSELIPSLVAPGSPFGANYTYTDTAMKLRGTYYYWLEDVDIYGKTGVSDPVEASLAGLPPVREPTIRVSPVEGSPIEEISTEGQVR